MLWLCALLWAISLEVTLLGLHTNSKDDVLSQTHRNSFLRILLLTFIFISESELILFQVGSLKKTHTFQIFNYAINTLNVKIEQHMAKEIRRINQLNGMTQTDMIRQICVLQ